jgi:hypothetical protein
MISKVTTKTKMKKQARRTLMSAKSQKVWLYNFGMAEGTHPATAISRHRTTNRHLQKMSK